MHPHNDPESVVVNEHDSIIGLQDDYIKVAFTLTMADGSTRTGTLRFDSPDIDMIPRPEILVMIEALKRLRAAQNKRRVIAARSGRAWVRAF